MNGGSDSARSSIDYGARPDAGGATVVDIGSGGGGGGGGALAAPVASVPRDSPKSNEAAAAALLTKFSGGGGGGDDDDAKPAEPRPSTPKSMTPTPSPLGSPSKTKSGGRRSKLALRSSEGSMTSLDGGGGASRLAHPRPRPDVGPGPASAVQGRERGLTSDDGLHVPGARSPGGRIGWKNAHERGVTRPRRIIPHRRASRRERVRGDGGPGAGVRPSKAATSCGSRATPTACISCSGSRAWSRRRSRWTS